MKIKIDKIVLYIIFANAFFLRWVFPNQGAIKYLVLAAIILSVLLDSLKGKKHKIQIYKYSFLLMLVLMFNLFITHEITYFFDNILRVVLSFLEMSFLYNYYLQNGIQNKKKIFIFINLYFILNNIIIFIQMSGSGFLMRFSESSNNYYLDHICGLFGMSGTQNLMLFYCFVLVYDIYYLNILQHKRSSLLYILLITLLEIYICINNDSKSFFVLLIVYAVFVIESVSNTKNVINKLVQYMKKFIPALVICSVVIFINTELYSTFIRMSTAFLELLSIGRNSTYLGINDERARIIFRIIEKSKNLLLGTGFGHIPLTGTNDGIYHFGINSLSSFLYLGGLLFLVLYGFLFIKINLYVLKKHRRVGNGLLTIIFLVEYFILLYIGQGFFEVSQICFVAALHIVFYEIIKIKSGGKKYG